jgi:peptidyl-prolyl cis-trans isomerase C
MKKIVITALLASIASFNLHAADLATVNGKPIKKSLLDFILKNATDAGKPVDDNARASIMDKLITNEVIDQEAQKVGIDKQPEFLAKQELALHELRINAYIEDFIKKNPIDDKALQAEYEKQKSEFKGKEYKASHILVKTEDEAMDIIQQLAKGLDFANIAKSKSTDSGSKESGGDLGWFSPEGMVKPFGDALVKLEKGNYTPTPIQTEFGWHIIRLEDARDTQPPSFDSVKDSLRKTLLGLQLDKLVNGLKAKAMIVNNTTAKAMK